MTNVLLLLGLLTSRSAEAHFGNGLQHFHAGLLHPFSGLDHLAAAVAVGIWATRARSRLGLGLPFSFLAGMLIGVSLGSLRFSPEAGIVLSLGALGAILCVRREIPLPMGCVLAASLGAIHGLAHGAELTASSEAAAGLLASTALLHGAGYLGIQTVRAGLPARYEPRLRFALGLALYGIAATFLL